MRRVMMPESECPCCGKRLNAAMMFDAGPPPKPQDLTVCGGCGAVNEYAADMQLRLVPEARIQQPDMEQACQSRAQIRKLRKIGQVAVALVLSAIFSGCSYYRGWRYQRGAQEGYWQLKQVADAKKLGRPGELKVHPYSAGFIAGMQTFWNEQTIEDSTRKFNEIIERLRRLRESEDPTVFPQKQLFDWITTEKIRPGAVSPEEL